MCSSDLGTTVGTSLYITDSEVKWRGDGSAHFSIFNQSSQFTIRNTSVNSATGTAGTTYVTIDTSGNVGIGTTPGDLLHVYASAGSQIRIDGGSGGSGDPCLAFYGGATFRGRVAYSTAGGYMYYQNNTQDVIRLYNGSGGALVLQPTSGNVGIGTVSPTDSLVLGSGSIIINNSTSTSNAYYFNQNSVYGGMDIENISNTGAQTINYGINTNRAKPWNSSYIGLWMRVDTRTGYPGFHWFSKAATSGTESEIMTLLPGGNLGIGTTSPQTLLDVNGSMNAYNYGLPTWTNQQ